MHGLKFIKLYNSPFQAHFHDFVFERCTWKFLKSAEPEKMAEPLTLTSSAEASETATMDLETFRRYASFLFTHRNPNPSFNFLFSSLQSIEGSPRIAISSPRFFWNLKLRSQKLDSRAHFRSPGDLNPIKFTHFLVTRSHFLLVFYLGEDQADRVGGRECCKLGTWWFRWAVLSPFNVLFFSRY